MDKSPKRPQSSSAPAGSGEARGRRAAAVAEGRVRAPQVHRPERAPPCRLHQAGDRSGPIGIFTCFPSASCRSWGHPAVSPPGSWAWGAGCVRTSRSPSSATSPPPTQLRANPGPATYWLCDLRSDNCGHTCHPPQRRGQMHVQQGCSRVESAPLRPWAQCWLLY